MACQLYNVTISSLDTGNATGNTNPVNNGKVYVAYYNCNGVLTTTSFSNGSYTICTDIQNGLPSLYYFKNDSPLTASNSTANDSGSQCQETTFFEKCCEQGGTIYEVQSGLNYIVGSVYTDNTDCYIAVASGPSTATVDDTGTWVSH